jgi:hypothetical protein
MEVAFPTVACSNWPETSIGELTARWPVVGALSNSEVACVGIVAS